MRKFRLFLVQCGYTVSVFVLGLFCRIRYNNNGLYYLTCICIGPKVISLINTVCTVQCTVSTYIRISLGAIILLYYVLNSTVYTEILVALDSVICIIK